MWWSSLSDFQQVVFIVAASATVLLLIFLILLLFGLGDESFDGGDADLDDFDIYNDEPLTAFSGLRILSLRGVLSFLSVGGWVAFITEPNLGIFWAIVLGLGTGFITALLLALAFRWSLKLESSGNIDYHNAIGKTARVYLRIPKMKTGTGKVNLIVQERLVEVSAVTNNSEDIIVNAVVIVTGLEDDNTLIVELGKDETND